MNALWITRMSRYQRSRNVLESARRILKVKIDRQGALLKRYKRPAPPVNLDGALSVGQLLLLEARAAKHYWRELRILLPEYQSFVGRRAGSPDPVNKLLDVGYHHLGNEVRKICERQDISTALGLLHAARSARSAPLVYDLMELFRSDVVDAELLRFLRLKKKSLVVVGQEDIGHFLHEINERFGRLHYLRNFRQCHSYRYYMELQVLRFTKAVNHYEVFMPLYLPTRHDTRCRRAVASTQACDIVGDRRDLKIKADEKNIPGFEAG